MRREKMWEGSFKMALTISEKCRNIHPSVTLAIDARAKQLRAMGLDVIGFGAGEPDFDTPRYIKSAARDALDAGMTKYTPVAGTVELRTEIQQKLLRDNGLDYELADIIVSSGAKQCLFNALSAILDPGDEVLLPSPCWVSYPEMVRMAGGVPVMVKGDEANGFLVDADALRPHVTERTKALILNSPNNPSGSVCSRALLEGIAALAVEKQFYVISDEIYEKLIYDGEAHVSIASLGDEIRAQTIVVNGVSKSYAMTGWRIGYLAGPAEIVDRMTKCQENFNACANAIGQYAAVAALDHPELCTQLRDIFARRRATLLEGLAAIPGMNSNDPTGAFYVFADIRAFGMSSEDFCNRLLDEERVVCIPGSAFGACGEGFVRIAYTCSDADLTEAIARIRRFCAKYYTA